MREIPRIPSKWGLNILIINQIILSLITDMQSKHPRPI